MDGCVPGIYGFNRQMISELTFDSIQRKTETERQNILGARYLMRGMQTDQEPSLTLGLDVLHAARPGTQLLLHM